MREIFFSRARFAYVIQKPISWIFAYLAYLDGDSGSPFPRWTHNENCAVWLPRKSCSQRHTAYAGYAGAYGKRKEKELARSHLIAFRLTDVEYDLVTRMAKEAGLSASAYIRKLLLDGKVNITYEVVADVPELQKLAAEFGKIGSNLNQIARYFHMGGIRSKAMQDEIHECISQIFDMRKEVAEMAGDYHGSVETYRKQKR